MTQKLTSRGGDANQYPGGFVVRVLWVLFRFGCFGVGAAHSSGRGDLA